MSVMGRDEALRVVRRQADALSRRGYDDGATVSEAADVLERLTATTEGAVKARDELEALVVAFCQAVGEPIPVDAIARARQLRGAVRALDEARLYGEKMLRDRDETVRRCGADLVQLIDAERERS